jgi:hypothetical protein
MARHTGMSPIKLEESNTTNEKDLLDKSPHDHSESKKRKVLVKKKDGYSTKLQMKGNDFITEYTILDKKNLRAKAVALSFIGDNPTSTKTMEMSFHDTSSLNLGEYFVGDSATNGTPNKTEEVDEVSDNVANQDSLDKAKAEAVNMTPIKLKYFSDNNNAKEKVILDESPHDPRDSENYKKWKTFLKKNNDDSSRPRRIANFRQHSHVGSAVLGLHRKMLSSNLYYPSWTTRENECINDGNEPQ